MDISAIMDFMVIAEQFFFSPPPQGFDPRSLVTLSYEADAITVRPGCPRATYCEFHMVNSVTCMNMTYSVL